MWAYNTGDQPIHCRDEMDPILPSRSAEIVADHEIGGLVKLRLGALEKTAVYASAANHQFSWTCNYKLDA